MYLKFLGIFALILVLLLNLAAATAINLDVVAAAPTFGNSRFEQLWNYSDKVVEERTGVGRGYTWGPNSFGVIEENYEQAPSGKRLVQYFDKSRMELASDGVFVTNGLLTKELVSGLRQDGAAKFTQLSPSTVQIAGDDNSGGANSSAPTYASFKQLVSFDLGQNRAENRVGQDANLALNRAGVVSTLTQLPAQLPLASYEETLGHNIPKVFQDFQNLSGQVWNGSYITGPIYTTNPTANVFGYPVSEPYWIRATVGGIERDVLVQLFERRVLTYTPTNADPFKVEMGNIGQHYYRWRYGNNTPPSTPTPASPSFWKPNLQTSWQWQLSGKLDLSIEATMYDIDLFGDSGSQAQLVAQLHAKGRQVVCYLSAGSWEDWREDAKDFPSEVLGNDYTGWAGEKWLDIRRLDLLAPIMRKRLDLCKASGFDGVEPDNIDGYTNDTGFPLTAKDQLAYNIWLANEAHQRGLSIALKNDPDQVSDLLPYFDWALAEDCFDQDWCDKLTPFVKAGKAVFAAEYTDGIGSLSNKVCTQASTLNFNLILKHRELDAWRKTCS